MRVLIHRGTREIGGSCIELEANGARLLLDLGLPLDSDPADASLHPQVAGLDGGGDLVGLVLSHAHLDHTGLSHLVGPDVPVAIGAATLAIMQAAAPFMHRSHVPKRAVNLEEGEPLCLGPFRITPRLVDHSAYDAYALEVEAGGRRLFYSGDFRGHGRKAALFERLIRCPPQHIDALIMEGSTIGRPDATESFPTETAVEARFTDLFYRSPGLALVAASAQNIDRIVSLYRACKRSGRTLILDLYAAEILRATGNANIPQSFWPNVAIYVPHYQRVRIKRAARFDIIERHKSQRVFPEDLPELAPKAVMLFRPAMLKDLDRADCLSGALAIWSQWHGYLKLPRGAALLADFALRAIPLEHVHTSGHAGVRDLQRFAAAIAPRALIPIHTFEAGRFPELFGPAVTIKNDGEWWEV